MAFMALRLDMPSLSLRRAWIEIMIYVTHTWNRIVALLTESVD